jgi:hypothetical protein
MHVLGIWFESFGQYVGNQIYASKSLEQEVFSARTKTAEQMYPTHASTVSGSIPHSFLCSGLQPTRKRPAVRPPDVPVGDSSSRGGVQPDSDRSRFVGHKSPHKEVRVILLENVDSMYWQRAVFLGQDGGNQSYASETLKQHVFSTCP